MAISWLHGEQMKEVPLTRGMVALVDDGDYEEVNKYKWCAAKQRNTWYAVTFVGRGRGNQRRLFMHWLILGSDPDGRTVDHRNGIGTDNQRHNLRWATRSQQASNAPARSNNTSGFKGVSLKRAYSRRTKRWRAVITAGKKQRHLGYFETAEAAAEAYDKTAVELFGEFARLNFPDRGEREGICLS